MSDESITTKDTRICVTILFRSGQSCHRVIALWRNTVSLDHCDSTLSRRLLTSQCGIISGASVNVVRWIIAIFIGIGRFVGLSRRGRHVHFLSSLVASFAGTILTFHVSDLLFAKWVRLLVRRKSEAFKLLMRIIFEDHLIGINGSITAGCCPVVGSWQPWMKDIHVSVSARNKRNTSKRVPQHARRNNTFHTLFSTRSYVAVV